MYTVNNQNQNRRIPFFFFLSKYYELRTINVNQCGNRRHCNNELGKRTIQCVIVKTDTQLIAKQNEHMKK